jgi:6-phosphofructokinase
MKPKKTTLKVAILTSGGDCQPMNNVIATLVRKILAEN